MSERTPKVKVAVSVTWGKESPEHTKVLLFNEGLPLAEYTMNPVSLARVVKNMALLCKGEEVNAEGDLDGHEIELIGFVAEHYSREVAVSATEAFVTALRLFNAAEFDEEVGQATTIYVGENGAMRALALS